MDEIQEKQWIISRLDHTFNFYTTWFKKKESNLESFIKNQVSTYTKLRNGILAVVAFLVTLIIGLHTIQIYFVPTANTIGALLLIGFTTYIVALIFEQQIQSALKSIEEESKKGHTGLYYVLGYFNRSTMDITEYTKSDYLNFINFLTLFIAPSLDLNEYFIIKKKLSSIRTSFFLSLPITVHLRKILNDDKLKLEKAADDFEKKKKDFENIDLLKDFITFGNALQNFKNGKQTNPLEHLINS